METIILDTETTDAADDRELIEAAYVPVHLQAGNWYVSAYGTPFEQRYKPTSPITFGAMATHHILPEDLEDCPPPSTFALPEGVTYLIGHAIDFDWETIGRPDVKRICTLAMARRVWPDVSHSLSALMYMLSDDYAKTREELRNAHSAGADVDFCRIILDAIMLKAGPFDSFEALHAFSEECRIPTHMTFGKHNGMAIAELPLDYVCWFLNQADVEPYLRVAFEKRLDAHRARAGLPPRVVVSKPLDVVPSVRS